MGIKNISLLCQTIIITMNTLTINELFLELKKKIAYIIELDTRYNELVIRIGFSIENTKSAGPGCYYDDILKYIPPGFDYIIQPNRPDPGEEIVIYKSK